MLSLLILCFALAPAHADWEANFTAQSTKARAPHASGKFYSKVDRFRVDTNVPFDLSIYAKAGSSHIYAAGPSFHIRLSSDLEKFSAQIPACLASTFEDCVKRFSMKKVGEESCGEKRAPHTCEVYVSERARIKGIRRIELHHWKGEKEPILTSSRVTKSNGEVISTTFTKIRRKSHDLSFYTVPSGYVNAGSLEKFFGDFRSKSE
jgi:hypothetical protein